MRQSSRAVVIKDNQLLLMKRNKFGKNFFSLIGGEIEAGEKPDDAVIREVLEESSLQVGNPRIVIIEDAGEVFGMQYIFLCDYISGEPVLDPSSTEAKISAGQQNTYQPLWIPISELEKTNLLPIELKSLLMKYIKEGFPEKPVDLNIDNIQTS